MRLVNPFEADGRWFKANLHTHTTTSDGEAAVEQRVEQYRRKGYDILAITDHRATNNVESLSSKDFLVIGGMETHAPCPYGGELYHLVCLNVPHGFGFPENEQIDADTQICLAGRAGGEVIVAHPYWCGHNINHLLAIDGYIGIEVYNAMGSKIGKAVSSVQWDDLLDAGRIVPAVAVDDVHEGRDRFMGWTMIKAKDLTTEAIMQAIRTGCYYSTCGPDIEDFRVDNLRARVKCSPAEEIHFMGQRLYGFSYYADGGEMMSYAEFDLRPDFRYIRVEVVDRKSNRAWTNPIILWK